MGFALLPKKKGREKRLPLGLRVNAEMPKLQQAEKHTTVHSPSLHKMAPELLCRRGEGPAPAPLPGAFLLAVTFLAPVPN